MLGMMDNDDRGGRRKKISFLISVDNFLLTTRPERGEQCSRKEVLLLLMHTKESSHSTERLTGRQDHTWGDPSSAL